MARPHLYSAGQSEEREDRQCVQKHRGEVGGVISPQASPMWTSINSLALPLLLKSVMGQPQLLVGGIAAQRCGSDCEFIGYVVTVLPREASSRRKKGEDSVKTDIKGGCNELNTLS